MRMKLVSVRLKPDKIEEGTMIAGSMDAAIFLSKKFDDNIQENAMYAINLSSKGKVESVDVCAYETFRRNMNVLLAGSVLSNAASTILASRGRTDEKDLLIERYINNAALVGIPCLDHICFDDEALELKYYSYASKGIFEFGAVLPERILATAKPMSFEDINKDVIRVKMQTDKYFKTQNNITVDDAIDFMTQELRYMDREYCAILSIADEKPINASYISVGALNSAPVSIANACKVPLLSGADSVIFMHNHPSGNIEPSAADIDAARRLSMATQIFGIRVKDSIVIGALSGEQYSMRAQSDLNILPVKEVEEIETTKKQHKAKRR